MAGERNYVYIYMAGGAPTTKEIWDINCPPGFAGKHISQQASVPTLPAESVGYNHYDNSIRAAARDIAREPVDNIRGATGFI